MGGSYGNKGARWWWHWWERVKARGQGTEGPPLAEGSNKGEEDAGEEEERAQTSAG